MSFGRQMWCHLCCAMVEAGLKEVAASMAGPILGALGGAAHGASRRRPSFEDVILKAGVGAALGFVAQAALPKAQQLACANCGCTHLSSQAPA